MRIAAPHHDSVGLARQIDVVGVMPFATQQNRVFAARHRLTDRVAFEFEHRFVDIVVHERATPWIYLKQTALPRRHDWLTPRPPRGEAGHCTHPAVVEFEIERRPGTD